MVNLYPFKEIALSKRIYEDCIENIDIGGSAMIRAAAKNNAHVIVTVDPQDYKDVINKLSNNDELEIFKKRMAYKAFQVIYQF